ncbi:aldehyde-activating protein [Methylophaga sp. 42_25_T18]|nr:aldehyde-activating protein [Methylophaga sp. 42_25_T18]
MSDVINAKGSCLCGNVQVSVQQQSPKVGVCHCSNCRNWTGGPFVGVDCGTDVQFTGSQSISAFKSSDWAERGFCNNCGTHLFYRFLESQQYIMPAGLFDDDQAFEMDHQIFIDEKPNYYSFINKTDNMTGAEVFAKYASADD